MVQKLFLVIIYFLIGIYQRIISPFLGSNCRFFPSCSAYAREALQEHGIWAGTWMTVGRFFSCHPWSAKSWHDPVPVCTHKNVIERRIK